MKAQIASLNARLAQHAQHAEHLLAGTEAFFGPKAGTIIGQALEEEDSRKVFQPAHVCWQQLQQCAVHQWQIQVQHKHTAQQSFTHTYFSW